MVWVGLVWLGLKAMLEARRPVALPLCILLGPHTLPLLPQTISVTLDSFKHLLYSYRLWSYCCTEESLQYTTMQESLGR